MIQNEINIKTYIIRGFAAVIITILTGWLLFNDKSILCGIVCVFPALELSLNDELSMNKNISIIIIQTSASNIFSFCVAKFYLDFNTGIIWSLFASYCIILTLVTIPIFFCVEHVTQNIASKHLQYWHLQNKHRDQSQYSINAPTIAMYANYGTNDISEAHTRTTSCGDL